MSRTGSANSNWRGGRVRGGEQGRYWMRYVPDHPAANPNGYVLEHRLVVEKRLGRYLTADEIVHHVNEDTEDNRDENLELMDRAEHARRHNLKTHCVHGHELTPENTYRWSSTGKSGRQCRACALDRARRSYMKRKAA